MTLKPGSINKQVQRHSISPVPLLPRSLPTRPTLGLSGYSIVPAHKRGRRGHSRGG